MKNKIKVADEVWISTALLHKENPKRFSFAVFEIVDRIAKENIYGRLRPGVQIHVYLHCVANKRPNPGNYRILMETQDKRRRLFKDSDDYHLYREGGKKIPKREEIPSNYHYLMEWYEKEYNR